MSGEAEHPRSKHGARTSHRDEVLDRRSEADLVGPGQS